MFIWTKVEFLSNYIWYAPSRHKMGNIQKSKILHERRGKIFGGKILEVYAWVPTFLRGELLSNSRSYGKNKIFRSVIHQKRNVLKHVYVVGSSKYLYSWSHISVTMSPNNPRETQEVTSGSQECSLWMFSPGVHTKFYLVISPILRFCVKNRVFIRKFTIFFWDLLLPQSLE